MDENKIERGISFNTSLIKEDEKLYGKYIIATNRKELILELMISIYKTRDISEKDFSTIKGPLKIRPMFLHKDERIESIVFLSMCALLIYSILKLIILENGIDLTVNRVLNSFEFITVGYYEFVDGSIF